MPKGIFFTVFISLHFFIIPFYPSHRDDIFIKKYNLIFHCPVRDIIFIISFPPLSLSPLHSTHIADIPFGRFRIRVK